MIFHQLLNIFGVWNERSRAEGETKELRRNHMNDHYKKGKKIIGARKQLRRKGSSEENSKGKKITVARNELRKK
jgi:hypothetical protein